MAIILLPLVLLPLALAIPHVSRASKFNSTIEWRSCPEVKDLVDASNGVEGAPFDCATLPVPLDYEANDGVLLDLALFRVNATKEPVLGTVLFNPGGPGGTGGENLPIQGPDIVETLGGQYHVVSWDPRGTGNTLPFNCNHTQFASTLSKRDEAAHLINTNVTEYFLSEGWEASVAYADACFEQMQETGRLIGTAYTARDMLAIVDALSEGGQLRYWGLSYGTALGNYFAALFPDRIERMLLDANMNPWEYRRGSYGPYPQDSDKTFNAFLDECIKNAPNCSLATSTNASSSADIIEAINASPNIGFAELAASASTSTADYYALLISKFWVFRRLYDPIGWPTLAEDLAFLLAGKIPESLLPANTTGDAPPKYNALAPNALDGIRCSDALWSGTTDPLEILDDVEKSANTSLDFADTLFTSTWACAAWKLPAKERLEGPFEHETSFPILFVNGLFDPATPAAFAVNASMGYKDSKVLLHNGYGHGLMANPSECVKGYVSRYFMDGELPEESGEDGEICERDQGPWEMYADRIAAESSATESAGSETSSASGSTTSAASSATSTVTSGAMGRHTPFIHYVWLTAGVLGLAALL
ncbi:putative hydrolase [Cyphellophora attinorum]|uniref:Putative hydrolase n=1 Tax=Cyphellophora attinorum TaxID=1664694 RepID=A0A0N0NR06_9EURO|nr:putative hydrolase [Phialophora attinorum]KPI44279.1 putative hydrolase [Phialophora attinorum]